ncbi:hypothetical protein HDU96_003740 [Phlyctochytrium bullatum]|nr:hypothetical protein HDU96_003740 [Phlyctochytrium bullatum]
MRPPTIALSKKNLRIVPCRLLPDSGGVLVPLEDQPSEYSASTSKGYVAEVHNGGQTLLLGYVEMPQPTAGTVDVRVDLRLDGYAKSRPRSARTRVKESRFLSHQRPLVRNLSDLPPVDRDTSKVYIPFAYPICPTQDGTSLPLTFTSRHASVSYQLIVLVSIFLYPPTSHDLPPDPVKVETRMPVTLVAPWVGAPPPWEDPLPALPASSVRAWEEHAEPMVMLRPKTLDNTGNGAEMTRVPWGGAGETTAGRQQVSSPNGSGARGQTAPPPPPPPPSYEDSMARSPGRGSTRRSDERSDRLTSHAGEVASFDDREADESDRRRIVMEPSETHSAAEMPTSRSSSRCKVGNVDPSRRCGIVGTPGRVCAGEFGSMPPPYFFETGATSSEREEADEDSDSDSEQEERASDRETEGETSGLDATSPQSCATLQRPTPETGSPIIESPPRSRRLRPAASLMRLHQEPEEESVQSDDALTRSSGSASGNRQNLSLPRLWRSATDGAGQQAAHEDTGSDVSTTTAVETANKSLDRTAKRRKSFTKMFSLSLSRRRSAANLSATATANADASPTTNASVSSPTPTTSSRTPSPASPTPSAVSTRSSAPSIVAPSSPPTSSITISALTSLPAFSSAARRRSSSRSASPLESPTLTNAAEPPVKVPKFRVLFPRTLLGPGATAPILARVLALPPGRTIANLEATLVARLVMEEDMTVVGSDGTSRAKKVMRTVEKRVLATDEVRPVGDGGGVMPWRAHMAVNVPSLDEMAEFGTAFEAPGLSLSHYIKVKMTVNVQGKLGIPRRDTYVLGRVNVSILRN